MRKPAVTNKTPIKELGPNKKTRNLLIIFENMAKVAGVLFPQAAGENNVNDYIVTTLFKSTFLLLS
ncbi:hypothetical protein Patl1_15289 [Pistacia atlantica]|uniref:Uncharacterized protein n=1 Tax=Pistacia atlantica TaxID=434234 RepID=A0ACC1B841_9ROSI|nr:hypothetical protein Patl1_15289 [Pistacia atlantica]